MGVPLLLHCITLPHGSDVFWNIVQEAFHHSDWRVRFTAVERVTIIFRFMDSTPLRSEVGLQTSLATAFCHLIASMDDINVHVAQRATLYLGTIHDQAIQSLLFCLESQFDLFIVDRPVVLQSVYQLHNSLSDRKVINWDFFLNRFDTLFVEAQVFLEKNGDITFLRGRHIPWRSSIFLYNLSMSVIYLRLYTSLCATISCRCSTPSVRGRWSLKLIIMSQLIEICLRQDLRNSDTGSEILTTKITRAREALSQVSEQGATSQGGAPSGKTLSASFGPKWPYKRTMSAPASIVPRQDSKMGIPLTFPFPKIFFSNQVLVPSTEKEKIYSRQISAPILKRKTSRFGLGQFLCGSSNSNASTSAPSSSYQPPAPSHALTSSAATSNPATHTTNSNTNSSTHHHSHNPFSLHSHSHQVHPASSGLQSQSHLQGNYCGTPQNNARISVGGPGAATGAGCGGGGRLSASPSVKVKDHHHPHHYLSTHPHKQHHLHDKFHLHHDKAGEGATLPIIGSSNIGAIGGGSGGQGRLRACMVLVVVVSFLI